MEDEPSRRRTRSMAKKSPKSPLREYVPPKRQRRTAIKKAPAKKPTSKAAAAAAAEAVAAAAAATAAAPSTSRPGIDADVSPPPTEEERVETTDNCEISTHSPSVLQQGQPVAELSSNAPRGVIRVLASTVSPASVPTQTTSLVSTEHVSAQLSAVVTATTEDACTQTDSLAVENALTRTTPVSTTHDVSMQNAPTSNHDVSPETTPVSAQHVSTQIVPVSTQDGFTQTLHVSVQDTATQNPPVPRAPVTNDAWTQTSPLRSVASTPISPGTSTAPIDLTSTQNSPLLSAAPTSLRVDAGTQTSSEKLGVVIIEHCSIRNSAPTEPARSEAAATQDPPVQALFTQTDFFLAPAGPTQGYQLTPAEWQLVLDFRAGHMRPSALLGFPDVDISTISSPLASPNDADQSVTSSPLASPYADRSTIFSVRALPPLPDVDLPTTSRKRPVPSDEAEHGREPEADLPTTSRKRPAPSDEAEHEPESSRNVRRRIDHQTNPSPPRPSSLRRPTAMAHHSRDSETGERLPVTLDRVRFLRLPTFMQASPLRARRLTHLPSVSLPETRLLDLSVAPPKPAGRSKGILPGARSSRWITGGEGIDYNISEESSSDEGSVVEQSDHEADHPAVQVGQESRDSGNVREPAAQGGHEHTDGEDVREVSQATEARDIPPPTVLPVTPGSGPHTRGWGLGNLTSSLSRAFTTRILGRPLDHTSENADAPAVDASAAPSGLNDPVVAPPSPSPLAAASGVRRTKGMKKASRRPKRNADERKNVAEKPQTQRPGQGEARKRGIQQNDDKTDEADDMDEADQSEALSNTSTGLKRKRAYRNPAGTYGIPDELLNSSSSEYSEHSGTSPTADRPTRLNEKEGKKSTSEIIASAPKWLKPSGGRRRNFGFDLRQPRPAKRVRLGEAIYGEPDHVPYQQEKPLKPSIVTRSMRDARRDRFAALSSNLNARGKYNGHPQQRMSVTLKREYGPPAGAKLGLSEELLDDSDSDIEVELDENGLLPEAIPGVSQQTILRFNQARSGFLESEVAAAAVIEESAEGNRGPESIPVDESGYVILDGSSQVMQSEGRRSMADNIFAQAAALEQAPVDEEDADMAQPLKGFLESFTNVQVPGGDIVVGEPKRVEPTTAVDAKSVKSWTQPPPPRPMPAHATLPKTPVKGTFDEAALARARSQAEKYKPKRSSGLRASSRLSASTVDSDAGHEAPAQIIPAPGILNGQTIDPAVWAAAIAIPVDELPQFEFPDFSGMPADLRAMGIEPEVWAAAVASFHPTPEEDAQADREFAESFRKFQEEEAKARAAEA